MNTMELHKTYIYERNISSNEHINMRILHSVNRRPGFLHILSGGRGKWEGGRGKWEEGGGSQYFIDEQLLQIQTPLGVTRSDVE